MQEQNNKNSRLKIDKMLLAAFLSTLFYSATYPYIHKIVVTQVSNTYLAINQIINCVSIIIYTQVYNRFSDKLFKYFPMQCLLETTIGICTTAFAIITGNIKAYYMLDTLVFAAITRGIICGETKLEVLVYNTEKKREQYDNNLCAANATATIIGSTVAMFMTLNINAMLILSTIGNAIDNIIYIIIYHTLISP